MKLELPKYDLDHSRPVIGYGNFTKDISNSINCVIDTTIVEKKFALWDYVMKNNLLDSKDELIRAQAMQLLRDKTIFLYAFAKLDGKPVKARWTQDIVLSDKSKRVIFCACNQHLGKSTALDFDASTEFFLDHSKRWLGILVSGSLPQSQERMRNIKLLLDSMDIKYKVEEIDVDAKGKSNATQLSYFFIDPKTKKPLYSNFLICCPHTSSALGYPADDIYLDEVDFWEDVKGGQVHFFNQVLDPRTYFTKGRIKGYSNPNGKERMMWFLWNQKDKKGIPFWKRYHFNYWDKPEPSQDDFDRSCIGKTKNEIESTLLAAFTTQEGSFFSVEEIQGMHCPELDQKGDSAGYGKETAWFIDIGAVHDQSVLIGGYIEENKEVPEIPLLKVFFVHKYPVGYPIPRVIGIGRTIVGEDGKLTYEKIDPDDGWDDYAEDNPSVKQILDDYSDTVGETKYQPLFGFDATGDAGLKPLFQAADIEAVDITFTGKLKWHMYQRYQYYVQQRFLKRAKERDENTTRGCDFDYQASKLVIKKNTKTVYKQIHHENEDDLDDTQDAMAGFIHLIENPDLPSLSFDIIKHKGARDEGEENKDRESSEEDKRLDGQYIPSFMDKKELGNWMDNRERQLE